MNAKTKLKPKQEKFCNKYIECGNASEAFRYSYSCKNYTDKSIWEKASTLLSKVKVRSRIDELQADLKSKSDITKERVLDEYSKIAFSNISHLHNTWVDRKKLEDLTEEQKCCIKSIQTRVKQLKGGVKIPLESGSEALIPMEELEVKIELYDKLRALDSITKMLGFDAPTKHELTGKDGEDLVKLPESCISKLSDEQRKVLLELGEDALNEEKN